MKGVDLSTYNNVTDYAKAAKAVDFVILKVINKSLSKDGKFETHYKGFTENGAIVQGVYNYSYATTPEKARKDANVVLSALDGRHLMVWLDVEADCLKSLGHTLIDVINAYAKVIKDAGLAFGIYTYQHFYKTYLAKYAEELPYPWWIARYPSSAQMDISKNPNEDYKPNYVTPLYGWQYSSKGSVPGISGNVDLNEWYWDIEFTNKLEEVNMSKTGQGLADFAESKIGTPYFYGAKWNKLTESYMATMHKMYPKIVTNSYMQKARNKGQVGVPNVDCSGLIYGYRGINKGSSQLYSTAKKRLPISQIDDFAIGTVLWKSGHVGVYVGNGKCVEAKGINYGVVKTDVSSQKWKYGLTFSDMSYSYDVKVEGTSKGINPYTEPTKTVTSLANAVLKGCKNYVRRGDEVRWIQWELVEAGYTLDIDGSCGPKTLAAIKEFQKSSKLVVDGLAGPATRRALKAN